MHKNKERGFITGPNGSDNDYFLERISKLTGVDTVKIRENELKDLRTILLQKEIEDESGLKCAYLLDKYLLNGRLSGLLTKAEHRAGSEKSHLLGILIDGLLDLESSKHSYGRHIPTYVGLLKEREQKFQKSSQKSLLIGALSIDTAVAFTAINKHILPNSQTFIIDIAGDQVKKSQNFSFADGAQTAFPKDSFTTVQTNSLLHALNHKNSETPRPALFKEIFRILQPSGALIMMEGNLGSAYNNYDPFSIRRMLVEELASAGFKDIRVTQPTDFKREKHTYNFLMSTNGSINPNHTRLDPHSLAISAIKST